MKIVDFMSLCLGSQYNTVSVEKPIHPSEPNEVIYRGEFASYAVPTEVQSMEFQCFSVSGEKQKLCADIVLYITQ